MRVRITAIHQFRIEVHIRENYEKITNELKEIQKMLYSLIIKFDG